MPSSTRRHRGATGLLGPCPWGTAWSSQSSCCTWSCAVLHYRAAGSECHTLPVSQADRGLWEPQGPAWLLSVPWHSHDAAPSGCARTHGCQCLGAAAGAPASPKRITQGHALLPTLLMSLRLPGSARATCSCCPQCCLCVGTAVLPSGRSGCTRDKQSQDCPGFTLLGLHLPTFLHAYSPRAPNPG